MSNTKDLCTLARAYQDLPSTFQTDSGGPNDALTAALITASSDFIEKYLRRRIYTHAYDELYDGHGLPRLVLRAYPIQSIQSVRYRPVTVLKITNTLPANVQARVSVTATGLTLVRVNAGTLTTDTSVTFAGNVTLAACVTALNALGNGWSASYVGDATNYGSWPSADLYVPTSFGDGLSSQGALQCVAGSFAELKMHTYEMQGYQFNPKGWLLRAIPYTDPELLHPEDLVWPVGVQNLRVQYTAGYTTIPETIQEACAELVAELYYQTLRDPAQQAFSNSGGANSYFPPAAPPARVKSLLAPYRRLL
jgi:hypothetical protein